MVHFVVRHHSSRSKQGNELVDRKACIPDNGAQQWLFDSPAGMNRHHRSNLARGVNQNEVASLLTILDESGVFKRPDDLPRG